MFKPIVTAEIWSAIVPHLPVVTSSGRGRPRCADRLCLEGILLVLRSGCRWRDLPDCLPSGVTCWRRLKEWHAVGCFLAVWAAALASDRPPREFAIDGSFVPAKKGAP